MKYLFFLFLFVTATWQNVFAQKQTSLSRSEIGFLLGGSYYIGDLNQFTHFKYSRPSASILYRFSINPRVTWRINAGFGQIQGDDSKSKDPVTINRNLSFRSDIFEIASGVEFHYFPFQLGHPTYKGTAYLLAEIGVFHMNPKTNYNGEWIELQPLGTEGQGSDLSSKKNYMLTQLCIPLAIGAKLSLGRKATLGVEYGIRMTFTDYLDDVKSDRYISRGELASANGPLTAALANRSHDQSDYGKRGNPATKDWYFFYGATITFRLGGPKKCVQP